jgi:protein SHQ1
MVVTPKFFLNQDDEHVIICIKVPYIKISGAEMLVDGSNFSFFCAPYLLKLHFPSCFAENADESPATYDIDNDYGTLTAKLAKKNKGEFFVDLDMLTTLFQTRKVDNLFSAQNLNSVAEIEVLHSENFTEESESSIEEAQQTLLVHKVGYGFNNQYFNVLQNLSEQCLDMFEAFQPEKLSFVERRWYRIVAENKRFDPERYLGDYLDACNDMLYITAMQYIPFWNTYYDSFVRAKIQLTSQKSFNIDQLHEKCFSMIGYTEDENEILVNLKRKEFLISPHTDSSIHAMIIDILLAYCYDYRLTNGEYNVESACNITCLSACLHWLDTPSNFQQHNFLYVIAFTMRRICIYPYLRVWKLGRKVLSDVAKIMFCGKRVLLKCFLHLKSLFEHSDTHYLLNKLFIDDLCIFIQMLLEKDVLALANAFNAAKNVFEQSSGQGKIYAGLNLVALEAHAQSHIQEDDSDVGAAIPSHLLQYDIENSIEPELEYLRQAQRDFAASQVSAIGDSENIAAAAAVQIVQRLQEDKSTSGPQAREVRTVQQEQMGTAAAKTAHMPSKLRSSNNQDRESDDKSGICSVVPSSRKLIEEISSVEFSDGRPELAVEGEAEKRAATALAEDMTRLRVETDP